MEKRNWRFKEKGKGVLKIEIRTVVAAGSRWFRNQGTFWSDGSILYLDKDVCYSMHAFVKFTKLMICAF